MNPATDSPQATAGLLHLFDEVRSRFDIPTQSCVLSHVTTTIGLIEAGAPVDLVFQSVAGTEGANTGFGVNISLLREGNRSEEHTSELQSLMRISYAVFCLKKKTRPKATDNTSIHLLCYIKLEKK